MDEYQNVKVKFKITVVPVANESLDLDQVVSFVKNITPSGKSLYIQKTESVKQYMNDNKFIMIQVGDSEPQILNTSHIISVIPV